MMEVVEAKGRTWGWQWRRNFGEYASTSIPSWLGKLQQTRSGDGVVEVFLGDGLEFATALKQVSDKHRQFALIHYCIPVPAKVKAHELNIHLRTYWQRRNAMRKKLALVLNL
jgi:hypothetical protein